MSMAFIDSEGGGGGDADRDINPPQPTKTPAQILAEQNASRISEVEVAASTVSGLAGGALSSRASEILSGVKSGIFSASDAVTALNNITSSVSTGSSSSGGNEKDDDDNDTSSALFAATQQQNQRDAFSRLRGLLSRFGLSELEGSVRNIITSGMVDLQDPNAIVFALRGEPAYKRRFAANEARARAGLAELDPSTYIGLEDAYRQMLQANGLPPDFYNDQSDFEKWIEGDVSPAELQERINQGYRRVADADPQVKAQMKELYGVSEGDLAAFFLDPKRTQPLLTTRERARKAQAAEIAARGFEQGRMQLTATEAENLAARGITGEQAAQGFGEMASLSGLYETMTGEQQMTREEQLGATFRYDTTALENLRRRQRTRLAAFEGGGQFARTSGATQGAIETGAGTAQ